MKYTLLEKEENGLYRILALKDFRDVKAGDIGGYVENENNLSQYGNCWIYDNAKVYNNAEVYGDARIYGNVEIYDNAVISSSAIVSENSKVFENARIGDQAEVHGKSEVYGDVLVCESADIYNCNINGNCRVGNPEICYKGFIIGYEDLCEDAWWGATPEFLFDNVDTDNDLYEIIEEFMFNVVITEDEKYWTTGNSVEEVKNKIDQMIQNNVVEVLKHKLNDYINSIN